MVWGGGGCIEGAGGQGFASFGGGKQTSARIGVAIRLKCVTDDPCWMIAPMRVFGGAAAALRHVLARSSIVW